MQIDIIMTRIVGPVLKPNELRAIRGAAILYLQLHSSGLSQFKVEDEKVEGFLEQLDIISDGPLVGMKFRADIGAEGGILREIEFVIPWDSINVEITENDLLILVAHGEGDGQAKPAESTAKSVKKPTFKSKPKRMLH